MGTGKTVGTIGGTVGGAALGSMVAPGLGTVAGGMLGGMAGGMVGGMFDGSDAPPDFQTSEFGGPGHFGPLRDKLEAGSDAGFSHANDVGNQQGDLGGMYRAKIAGTGPSVAAEQMKQGYEHQMTNANAMAASARGGGANQALAMQGAQQQNALGSQTLNQQQGLARAKESADAMQGYGGMLAQQRGQDQAQAGAYLGAAQGMQQAQLQAEGATQQANAAQRAAKLEADAKMQGGLMSGAGSIIGGLL